MKGTNKENISILTVPETYTAEALQFMEDQTVKINQ